MILLNLNSPVLKGTYATHDEDAVGNAFSFRDIAGKQWDWSKGQHPVQIMSKTSEVLNGAQIYTTEGFIQKNDGQFLRGTYWADSALDKHKGLRNWQTLLSRHLKGNWFSMLLYYSWGYYHWFCDALPRLCKVKDILPPDTQFIIHKNPPAWMLKSLELLDIPLSQCYEFDGKLPLRLETLYFTPPVAMTGDHDSEALQWVRDNILQRSGIATVTNPSLRLYVSRSAAGCRRLVNECDLTTKLEPLGFQLVQAEKLSFQEQIKLFSQAEWIIGPHGAGLTNMMYAPTGAKVIEIFEPSIIRRCYYQMSEALNHNHFIVVGSQKQNSDNEPDIYLQPQTIDTILEVIDQTRSY